MLLQLLNAVESKIIELSEQGIYFKAMIADAETPEGEKLCHMIGMDLITESNHNSKIFSVTLIPPEFKRASKLLVTLAEKYQNPDLMNMEPF